MDTTALALDKKVDQHAWTHWGHTEPSENTLDLHSLKEKRRLSVLFIEVFSLRQVRNENVDWVVITRRKHAPSQGCLHQDRLSV